MEIYSLLLGILGVWRITHLLSDEAGPEQLFTRLRRLSGAGFWGQLLACFYCLSVWIAAPFTLILTHGWRERLLLWPALSGAAILLERLTTERVPINPALYFEEPETQHVLR